MSRDSIESGLELRVTNILQEIGIPANLRGYYYIREAIIVAAGNINVISHITKSLYPAVAQKCGTTPSRVERAMRHAIDAAWSRGMSESINTVFGCTVNVNGGKPTNSEFIALIADRLRLEKTARQDNES
ncbi:MAG: sporulation initiation factor Spo0A C-terminal domain-containing protein [Oscillospiraceae bacterium]|jgi:two-component system response regulator (stage 0 sporulation protein A)|nr:sporulation initiation factor Spo0A C-terminal domain-containing protein [Oscillospiraceae bacterium]